MFYYEFEDVNDTDCKSDIAMHNMKCADESLDLKLFIAGSMGWIKTNSTKSYADLETELRNQHFNTHLYARKPQLPVDCKLSMMRKDDETKYIYECIFSCRPKAFALKEVLSFWPTYEDNLEALKVAGGIVLDDSNKKIAEQQDNFCALSEKDIDVMTLISENKKKVVLKHKTAQEVVDEMSKQIYKQTGIVPTHSVFAMLSKGGPLFGLSVNGKIASNIGYTITHDHEMKPIMELIKLQV